MLKVKMTLEQRFRSKFNEGNPNECWEWKAGCDKDGYGEFWLKHNKKVSAHRYIWELTFGEIPKGLCVLHHCDNPKCCNPGHLFLGTLKDNMDDKVNKNRQAHNRGEHAGGVKLTNKKVLEIRKLDSTNNYTQQQLADKFDVSVAQISRIINNKSWEQI
jgi:hypothetical protein